MAKTKTAPETTETETTGTETRATRGSSLAAQAKQLVLAISQEVKEHGGILGDTLEWLNKVADEFVTSSAGVGLTNEQKLVAVNAKLDAIYQGISDRGELRPNDVELAEIGTLAGKIKRINSAIKKENKSTETPA